MPEHRKWPDARVRPGSESRAKAQQGFPGTWEILPFPLDKAGGDRLTNPRPTGAASVPAGSEQTGAQAVPPSEGNEVTRDGRQEVVAS